MIENVCFLYVFTSTFIIKVMAFLFNVTCQSCWFVCVFNQLEAVKFFFSSFVCVSCMLMRTSAHLWRASDEQTHTQCDLCNKGQTHKFLCKFWESDRQNRVSINEQRLKFISKINSQPSISICVMYMYNTHNQLT
jgi:hypothetical protein